MALHLSFKNAHMFAFITSILLININLYTFCVPFTHLSIAWKKGGRAEPLLCVVARFAFINPLSWNNLKIEFGALKDYFESVHLGSVWAANPSIRSYTHRLDMH